LGCEEVALLKVTIELLLSQNTQDLVKMASMLLLLVATNKYVIKVMTINLPMTRLSTSFMRLMKVLGALVKPNGVINHS